MYNYLVILWVIISLLLFGKLIWSVFRTTSSVILSLVWDHRPIRIDLRIPSFPIDVVFVSKPDHIKAINGSAYVTRLGGSPLPSLPPWIQYFFPTTGLLNVADETWSLPVDPKGVVSNYNQRLKFYKDSLDNAPHTREDVLTVIPVSLRWPWYWKLEGPSSL